MASNDIEIDNTLEVYPVAFPAAVLARVAPEVSLQRHLGAGLRPGTLRKPEEFRAVSLLKSKANVEGILGSSVVHCGSTTILATITGGLIESEPRAVGNRTVFPIVEIQRGRHGTDEEMITAQYLHDTILHSGLIPARALFANPMVRTTNADGTYKLRSIDPADGALSDRQWEFVLYAKIVVISRTGPIHDLCWNALVYALQDTKLPRTFVDERAADLKVTIRTRGRSATINETYNIFADLSETTPLKLNERSTSFASQFGIVELNSDLQLPNDQDGDRALKGTILLADIDTEAEESTINSRITVICSDKGTINHLSIIGGDTKITPNLIKQALQSAHRRSNYLLSITNDGTTH